MKQLTRFQNWLLKVMKLDFDYNAAQKWCWDTAMKRGIEKGEQQKADCLNCRLYQQERNRVMRAGAMGAYERPDPTTYGKIAAQKMEQSFTIEPPTWFKKRNPDLIQTQHMLPRMTRKLTLEQHSEPPPDSTAYETPAFLQDQDKHVS